MCPAGPFHTVAAIANAAKQTRGGRSAMTADAKPIQKTSEDV